MMPYGMLNSLVLFIITFFSLLFMATIYYYLIFSCFGCRI